MPHAAGAAQDIWPQKPEQAQCTCGSRRPLTTYTGDEVPQCGGNTWGRTGKLSVDPCESNPMVGTHQGLPEPRSTPPVQGRSIVLTPGWLFGLAAGGRWGTNGCASCKRPRGKCEARSPLSCYFGIVLPSSNEALSRGWALRSKLQALRPKLQSAVEAHGLSSGLGAPLQLVSLFAHSPLPTHGLAQAPLLVTFG